MVQNQKSQWQKGLDSVIELSILQCSFNQFNYKLTLTKANNVALKNFTIDSEDNFKEFIRNTKIFKNPSQSHLKKNILQLIIQQDKRINNLTLEKFIILMFTNPQHCKSLFNISYLKNIFNSHFCFIGNYQNHIFEIKLFVQYDDNVSVIVMIEKKKNFEQKYLEKQFTFQQENIQQQETVLNQKYIRQSLINLKRFYQLSLKFKIKKLNFYPLIFQIRNDMYLYYNSYLNLKCLSSQYQNDQIIQFFYLQNIIDEIIDILNPSAQKKKVQFIILNPLKNLKIYSSYWMVFQILFNLILNSIQNSPLRSKIIIKLTQKNQGYFRSIQISIEDGGPKFFQKIVDNLPIIHPKNVSDMMKYSRNQKLKLGLQVSGFLISIIGPLNQIRVTNFKNSKQISFEIFENLERNRLEKFKSLDRFSLNLIQTESDNQIDLAVNQDKNKYQ